MSFHFSNTNQLPYIYFTSLWINHWWWFIYVMSFLSGFFTVSASASKSRKLGGSAMQTPRGRNRNAVASRWTLWHFHASTITESCVVAVCHALQSRSCGVATALTSERRGNADPRHAQSARYGLAFWVALLRSAGDATAFPPHCCLERQCVGVLTASSRRSTCFEDTVAMPP